MPFFLLLVPVLKIGGGIAVRFLARAAIRRAAPHAVRWGIRGLKTARTIILKAKPAAIAGDTYAGANIAGQLLEHGEVQDWEAVAADWTFGAGAYYATMSAFPKPALTALLKSGQWGSALKVAGRGGLIVGGTQATVGTLRSEVFGSPCGSTIVSASGQSPLITARKLVIGATVGLTGKWGPLLDAGIGASQEPIARYLTGTNPGHDQDGSATCSVQATRLFGGSEAARVEVADQLFPMGMP